MLKFCQDLLILDDEGRYIPLKQQVLIVPVHIIVSQKNRILSCTLQEPKNSRTFCELLLLLLLSSSLVL